MIKIRNYDYIVFDLDDTLIPSGRFYAEALAEIGIIDGTQQGDIFFRARKLVKERLSVGHVAARNRVLYFKAMLALQGRCASPNETLAFMERYEEALVSLISAWSKENNRLELIKEICSRIPCLILTNETLRTQLLKLRAIGNLDGVFKNIITSEEIGSEKPNLANFNTAISSCGCETQRILMVGDSIEADLVPAQKLGMGALLQNEFANGEVKHAGEIPSVNHLGEIFNWL